MSKIVIVNPGEIARAVDHVGKVSLEDLHRYVGAFADDREVTVDVRRLGRIPSGVTVDAWLDDEGLLWDDCVPNRRFPDGTEICGPILVCAVDGPESIALTDEDANWLVRDINARWDMLSPDHVKPEPMFRVSVL